MSVLAAPDLAGLGSVTVFPGGLLDSPVGFDGFDPALAVRAWAQSSWPVQLGPLRLECAHPTFGFVSPDVLLAAFVREFVRPAASLGPGVQVVCAPGGGWLELTGPLSGRERALLAASARIHVPAAALVDLCEAEFPRRGRGWLAFYAQAVRYLPVLDVPLPVDPLRRVRPVLVGSVVDMFARAASDDALGLAAEMFAAQRGDVDSMLRAGPVGVPQQAQWSSRCSSLLRELLVDVVVSARSVVDGSPSSTARSVLREALGSVTPYALAPVQPRPV